MSKRPPEPSRRQRWLPYVRRIADMIAMRDWTVAISEEAPSGDDSIASVNCCDGRKVATLRFSNGFFFDTRAEQRQTVLHELIHCHFAPFYETAKRKTRGDATIHMLMEYAVDGLADGFAPLLPLPSVK